MCISGPITLKEIMAMIFGPITLKQKAANQMELLFPITFGVALDLPTKGSWFSLLLTEKTMFKKTFSNLRKALEGED